MRSESIHQMPNDWSSGAPPCEANTYSGEATVPTRCTRSRLPLRMACTVSPGFRLRATAKRSLTSASSAPSRSGQRPRLSVSAFKPWRPACMRARSNPMKRPVTGGATPGRSI
ncbi:hypothetical protein D9M69_598730 [compost metagenome]